MINEFKVIQRSNSAGVLEVVVWCVLQYEARNWAICVSKVALAEFYISLVLAS